MQMNPVIQPFEAIKLAPKCWSVTIRLLPGDDKTEPVETKVITQLFTNGKGLHNIITHFTFQGFQHTDGHQEAITDFDQAIDQQTLKRNGVFLYLDFGKYLFRTSTAESVSDKGLQRPCFFRF